MILQMAEPSMVLQVHIQDRTCVCLQESQPMALRHTFGNKLLMADRWRSGQRDCGLALRLNIYPRMIEQDLAGLFFSLFGTCCGCRGQVFDTYSGASLVAERQCR